MNIDCSSVLPPRLYIPTRATQVSTKTQVLEKSLISQPQENSQPITAIQNLQLFNWLNELSTLHESLCCSSV